MMIKIRSRTEKCPKITKRLSSNIVPENTDLIHCMADLMFDWIQPNN